MLRELKNNERGIILITVLLIIIVMMIVTVSIVSLNVSQVTTAENEKRRLQAEVLGLGGVFYALANYQSLSPANVTTQTFNLDGFTYTVLTNLGTSGPGPQGTALLNVNVTY